MGGRRERGWKEESSVENIILLNAFFFETKRTILLQIKKRNRQY